MKHYFLIIICAVLSLSCSSRVEVIKAEFTTASQKYNDEKPVTYLELANSFYDKEQFETALVECHKSYAVDSTNWEVFYLYGQVAFSMELFERAENYYHKSLLLCNKNADNRAKIYFSLAENEDILGNMKLAKQHYLMVIQLIPESELAQSAYKKIQFLSQVE